MKYALNCMTLLLAVLFAAGVQAKLPAPSDEAKAKAAEATAKSGWAGKVDGYLLCKAQDRTVAHYKKTKADAKVAAPAVCADPGPFVYPPVAATSAPAAVAAAAPAPAAKKP